LTFAELYKIAGSSNGRTGPLGGSNLGSSPSPAATLSAVRETEPPIILRYKSAMALLNSYNLKTLVAIGRRGKGKKFHCYATGFLVGFLSKKSKHPEKRRYYIFLVTNRHVFEDEKSIHLRFNTIDGKVKIFKQDLFFGGGEPRWLAHRFKKVDLALLNVSPKILDNNKIEYGFITEELFAYSRYSKKDFKEIGIESGDPVFVLGFPLGISGNIQNLPCVKWGIISRADEEIIRENKTFLIDSSVFPGNSGGPVFLRPTDTALEKAKAVKRAYLIGVVSSYLPYTEKLYTLQTKPPAVVSTLKENSGLTFVVPMDFAHQIFKNWLAERKKLVKARKQKGQKMEEKIQS
jgi:hypothetical protein